MFTLLNLFLCKRVLDWFFHKTGVTENRHHWRTNQPQNRRNRWRKEPKRNSNNQQAGVQLWASEGGKSQVEVITLQAANTIHATGNKQNDKQQQNVGDQTVNRQQTKHNCIIGRKVAQVKVDTWLSVAPAGGFAESFVVKKVTQRLHVAQTRLQRTRLSTESFKTKSISKAGKLKVVYKRK